MLEHATIHTVAGATIEDGSIWFADGKIRAVLPAGRRVPDADLGDEVSRLYGLPIERIEAMGRPHFIFGAPA